MMKRELKRLQPKHHVILRLAFQGWSNIRIAAHVGLRREAISRILHSPVARAELARMQAEADEWVVNVPMRVWLINRLEGRSEKTYPLKRQLTAERRGGRGRRVISNRVMALPPASRDDRPEGYYRDLLRRLEGTGGRQAQVETPNTPEH